MRIVQASFEIESDLSPKLLIDIERSGRTCYKSECREINEATAKKFVAMIIRRGHESVLEHGHITVRFVINRGVSHETVRHRLASYSQESTRYCNYSGDKFGGELSLIPDMNGLSPAQVQRRMDLYHHAEDVYMAEVTEGVKPQQARDNLFICTKTELVMTANPREWRHFFKLRTAEAAHPQMREVARPLLREFRARCPVLFDDVGNIG